MTTQHLAQQLAALTKAFDSPEMKAAREYFDRLSSQLQEVVRPFRDIAEHMRRLPPAMREALMVLADRGWFLDPEWTIPELWPYRNALIYSPEDGEQLLANHYRARRRSIRESLCKSFAVRAPILASAFDADARADYIVSVPLFLIQADGICRERCKRQLFSLQPGKDLASYVAEIDADSITAAFLHPLAQGIPIKAKYTPGQAFDGLNRHMVLHGDSVDYGTELNSLKAMSLLNFVGHMIDDDEPQPSRKKSR